MLFRTLFTFAALASTACARLAGVPERTELVATVPCLTDRTCHHGKCRLVIDDDVWTFGNATPPRPTLSISTPNRTLNAVPQLVCLCDDGWATVDASEPCAYPRKSRLYIVLMQFFFGFLGVGAFLLGWTAWGAAVLALSVAGCVTKPVFQSRMRARINNTNAHRDETDKSDCLLCGDLLCACSVCQLACAVIVVTTLLFVLTIVHCVDSHGVACK